MGRGEVRRLAMLEADSGYREDRAGRKRLERQGEKLMTKKGN
jgi:hypothetical protein